jgi:hypothetical protein
MTGDQLKHIRYKLGKGRHDFALLIGYTGSDRNNDLRVRRLEAEDQVPLYIGRLAWIILEQYEETGDLPHWPDHLHIEGEQEPWM